MLLVRYDENDKIDAFFTHNPRSSKLPLSAPDPSIVISIKATP